MRKRKLSKKKANAAFKKTSSLKAKTNANNAAKKRNKSAVKKQGESKDKYALKHWTQVPGTFTYKMDEPKNNWHFVCHADRQMTEAELMENVIAQVMWKPLKSGETRRFKAIDNAMQRMAQMIERAASFAMAQKSVAASKGKLVLTTGGVSPFSIPFETPPPPTKGACPQCHGRGWVCEDHPKLPWENKVDGHCPCEAPEMPCRICNPKAHIFLGPGDFAVNRRTCELCKDQRWLCVKHKKPWKLVGVGCKCRPGKPCPKCNAHGGLKLGGLKVIRSGVN